MLIIPVERKIDWRRPPIVTSVLILINLIVFFAYQLHDSKRIDHAAEFYLQEGLYQTEFAFYPTYLASHMQAQLAKQMRQADKDGKQQDVARRMMLDLGFENELRERKHDFFSDAEIKEWEPKRAEFDGLMRRVSFIAWGMTPAEHRPLTFITYQFMHGGYLHLFFNMLFLFIMGFTVEAALGYWKYPLIYIVAGVGGAAFHAITHADSFQPLVGASAAISGVMGMYAALFGMRKIQFFYWLGPYFNYIKLPALAILPVWLAKEISQYFIAQDDVAYMAHAGGLAIGAIITLTARKYLLEVEEQYFDLEEMEPDVELREALADALEQLGKFNFDGAKKRLYALKEKHPNNIKILEHLFHLEKLTPETAAYRERALELFTVAASSHAHLKGIHNAFKDYLKVYADDLGLNAVQIANLAIKFSKLNELGDAEKLIMRAVESQLRDPMLMKAALVLAREYDDNEQPQKGKRMRELAQHLGEDSKQGAN
ncbi:MAG TPA: rhomboid family intramembrane serine protease [Pseudomonadales bacterium]|nr:rhomboid family intramembrane serine protease [Pseudomonadales bacterium]